MGSLSRSQLVVYGAVAVVLLLVGARWIRSDDGQGDPAGEVRYGGPASAGDAAGLTVDPEGGTDAVVHVAGAVADPGVYRLPAGSRVTDAVERAGGTTSRAQVEAINLAARLVDGQQVVVPARVAGSASGATASATGPASAGPISLGSATVEELDTIEGIGPVTAQKILEYRQQQGGISSIDQLNEIDGIGPATMESLRSGLQP